MELVRLFYFIFFVLSIDLQALLTMRFHFAGKKS